MRSFQFVFVMLLLFTATFFFGVFFIPEIFRIVISFIKDSVLLVFGLVAVFTGLTGSIGGAISTIVTWETSKKTKPQVFWISVVAGSMQIVFVWLFLAVKANWGGASWEMSGCSAIAFLLGLFIVGPRLGSFWYFKIKDFFITRI